MLVLWPPRDEKKRAVGPKCFGCVSSDIGSSSGLTPSGRTTSDFLCCRTWSGSLRPGGGGRKGELGSMLCRRKSRKRVYSVSVSRRTGRSGGRKPSLNHDCINEAFHG